MIKVLSEPPSRLDQPSRDISRWLTSISHGRKDTTMAQIAHAADFAIKSHEGQKRASGEAYVNHSLAVAGIVHELGLDHEAVIAGLLHDTVEDTRVSLEEITEKFGPRVALLVDGVTKMEVIQGYIEHGEDGDRQTAKAESLRKMMLAMVEDVRVVLIKLCDRLHNMRTLQALPESKRRSIARETLDIFAPLANRLGVWQLKWELEDLSFRFLEPGIYEDITKKLAERRIVRHTYIAEFVEQLQSLLRENSVSATTQGRPKHVYSIWNKMRRKNIDFEHIFDVRAVRVLVEDVQSCYAALGVIHTGWNYIAGEFDDYIATPKENNYRSVHTAVIGPKGKVVEVQICTREMHESNELGVAAHWRYKEGRSGLDQNLEQKVLWLRQLLDWKDEVADANEFVDRVKDEVFEDRVYLFTPKGKVIDLPRGATPVDFAYSIHTEVGNRCRGARVNGRMVPLTHVLKTGERVEVITSKSGTPSLDWLSPHLGYTVTRRARSRIQHWFRHENREETIATGRSLLERELHRMGLTGVNLEKLAHKMGFDKAADLYFKLTDGSVKPGRVAIAAQGMMHPEEQPGGGVTGNDILPRRGPQPRTKPLGELSILGVGNLLTNIAGCCKPIPGDPILGFITLGRGVTIHREDCANLLHHRGNSPERVIEVEWGTADDETYPVDILVTAFNRKGLLRDIAAVFADEKIGITATSARTDDEDNLVYMEVTAEIPDIESMSRLLAKISQLQNIREARRLR